MTKNATTIDWQKACISDRESAGRILTPDVQQTRGDRESEEKESFMSFSKQVQVFLKADLHSTTLLHTTSLRQAHYMI